MLYQEIPPPPPLACFVRHFWYIEYQPGSCHITNIPFRLMADGFPSLIFQYKNRFKASGGLEAAFPASLLFGHTSSFRDLVIDGEFGVFGVALFPTVPSLLFQIPGREYANRIIDGDDLWQAQDDFLAEKINLAATHQERIDYLTAWLVARLHGHATSDTQVENALQLMVRTGGSGPIGPMAYALGLSGRQLERRFGQGVGMSPKTFSRVIRFQTCLQSFAVHRPKNLTELAFIRGYADQAHFIREFRAFSGLNPRHYFRQQAETAENLIQI